MEVEFIATYLWQDLESCLYTDVRLIDTIRPGEYTYTQQS